jgi:hypothetical protein
MLRKVASRASVLLSWKLVKRYVLELTSLNLC